MKIPELKEELKKLGLPVVGKKDDLVQRLIAAKSKNEEKGKDENEDKGNEGTKEEKEEKEDAKGKGKRKLEEDSQRSAKREKTDEEGILVHLKDEEWKTALAPEFAKPYFKGSILSPFPLPFPPSFLSPFLPLPLPSSPPSSPCSFPFINSFRDT
jgi:SAP domain